MHSWGLALEHRGRGWELAVDVSKCMQGDINVPVEDNGDLLGLDRGCVYHSDVNWEPLERRGGSTLQRGLDADCARWND
jgi:hypothetical protein